MPGKDRSGFPFLQTASLNEGLVSAEPDRPAVTTTDLLKLAGIVLLLLDHVGLFFDTDQDWWRVVGRVAAPIFFFLIGFARARTVPWSWIVLGTVLTFVEGWTAGEGASGYFLNILFNFALIRLALDAVERWIMPHPARIALLAAAFILLVCPLDPYLEYGAEGWLWALLGLAQRWALEGRHRHSALIRNLLALLVWAAYVGWESVDHEFGTAHTVVLALLIAALVAALVRFRRAETGWRPAPVPGAVVRACGRHSLEIYAGSVLAMQLGAYALGFR